MPGSKQMPVCRRCGNQMFMTRFQSTVSDKGIDRDQYYECLWCDETDFVTSYTPTSESKVLAA